VTSLVKLGRAACFSCWLRTIRNDVEPSEIVVSNALNTALPTFLIADQKASAWEKHLTKNIDIGCQGIY
jgi:hypothetical protein